MNTNLANYACIEIWTLSSLYGHIILSATVKFNAYHTHPDPHH